MTEKTQAQIDAETLAAAKAEKAAAAKAAKEAAKAEKAALAAKAVAEKAAKAAAVKAERDAVSAAKKAEKEAVKAAKEAAKQARVKQPEQNGMKQPKEGTKTRAVWDVCTKLSEQKGEAVSRAEVVEHFNKTDANPNMVLSQYAYWRKFHGITGRIVKSPEVAPSVPASAE